MKALNLILSLLLLSTQVTHADLATALDPWGARRNAAELRSRADDIRSQIASRRTAQSELQKEHDGLVQNLEKKRQVINGLRNAVASKVTANAERLEKILARQDEQIQASQAALTTALSVQKSVNSAMTSLSYLAGSSQALRILEPLFVNSAQNREMWMQALNQLEQKPGLVPAEQQAIQNLRAEIKNANDWFWRRPETLLSDFSQTMKSFNDGTTQALTQNLGSAANTMVDKLSIQLVLQTKLKSVVMKTKEDHELLLRVIL